MVLNDLDILRTRIGLTAGDTTRDADLTLAFDTALAIVERYCDRKFEALSSKETLIHVAKSVISLERYPIDRVKSLTVNGAASTEFHVERENGLIHFDGYTVGHEVVVEYDGGYIEAPSATFSHKWPSAALQ